MASRYCPASAVCPERREEADRFSWLYRNSLFLAFVLLFVLSLALHVVFGTNAYNEERALV